MSATEMVVWILGVMTSLVITSLFVGRYRRSHDDPPDSGSGPWKGGSGEGGGGCGAGGGCGGGG